MHASPSPPVAPSQGKLGLGKFIRLVPHPVMLGFVNGLAVVMTRAQLRHFYDPASGALLAGARATTMICLTFGTAAVIKLLPLLTDVLPASLTAITLASCVTRALRLPATTLGEVAGASTFTGGLAILPSLRVPAMGALRARPSPRRTLGSGKEIIKGCAVL